MKKELNNFAYIDGANLHKATLALGWQLDYRRFRVWLEEKYLVGRAYLFLGLVPKYKDLYKHLQEAGFTLVFKEVMRDSDGKVKGNCDADLVLQAVCDFYEKNFKQAVLISSDGDYASLVKFLLAHKKLRAVLSPSNNCSVLIKRLNPSIAYLGNQRSLLESKNKRAPDMDKTI